MKVIKCRLKAAGGVLQGGGVVYAKVIDAGRIDAESLVDMMAANCGVSRSQVLAVLTSSSCHPRKINHPIFLNENAIFEQPIV